MANENSIILSDDNKQPIKQANHELFSYEMTQVILMLKGEFSPERADSVINPNLTLPQIPIIDGMRKPEPKAIVSVDFICSPNTIDVSKPTTKVVASTGFVPAPSTMDVCKPKVEVTVATDFAHAPKEFEVLCKKTFVYIPNISAFDFWEDWTNSIVSKVFAKSGIIIRED